jgi:hypothetical protein
MRVRFHAHALDRLAERGATQEEVRATVDGGEQFQAKFGRRGFRRNFPFEGTWRGRTYATKQVEVYAVEAAGDWLVITVVVKYFGTRGV